ncbi:MAG: hypothetical protein GFH27_549307n141 [Chloroflexi bacterium AL-W]|nr:hypothetical protein [Chloroflexi bacterium AL-N1]NOK69173.1 hypothetical protein [Chloroflexi bacterium AL-N10]NOK77156.1 hypothetical protein [Chloroflexi bacterium AL-N5]NOK83801.1 hypothetical protein [Chloroflexi bacterium AL-W]NOK91011.1 hypothetical protein [Chloroflexi bacterium AL-N15]
MTAPSQEPISDNSEYVDLNKFAQESQVNLREIRNIFEYSDRCIQVIISIR